MSKDLYKAQAARLADHLTTKHGVKLKSASILEAVATLHGARDWNTLTAGAGNKNTNAHPEAESISAASHCAGELSAVEQLLRNALASNAHEFRFSYPTFAAREESAQGKLTYHHDGIRMHVLMSFERATEFRKLLLGLAGLSLQQDEPTKWSHGQFVYQGVTGSVRKLQTRTEEDLTVEWGRGASFTRRVESLENVESLVQHFANPNAHGMYLIASINGASSKLVTEALASRVPSRSYAETHDFEIDSRNPRIRCDVDVMMGELRTQEGIEGLIPVLETGGLSLTRVHAYGVEGALRRAKQVGLTDADLRQHLRGVLALTSLRTACTHCSGKGCGHCKKSGIGGVVHLYEYVVLDKAKDYDALCAGQGASLESQARELVAQGRVTLEEAQRVFGPDF